MEPAPTGDQLEQTVVEDKLTESTNQNQAVNNQSETNLSHSEEPHPLDKDQNYDKLLLTRGQDFDLDYTLLGNGSKIITRPIRDSFIDFVTTLRSGSFYVCEAISF